MNDISVNSSIQGADAAARQAADGKAPWVTPRLTCGSVAMLTEQAPVCVYASTGEYTASKLGS